MTEPFIMQISKELAITVRQVETVLALLKEGNTIPFIARYRKEKTGHLDEMVLRNIQERALYLQELEERRLVILSSIESQGKLTDTLKKEILGCTAKNTLEDLYLPYKPKRRTRGMIAREKGLEPLACMLLEQPITGSPEKAAVTYVDGESVKTVEEALSGARDIVAEMIAERADIRAEVRHHFTREGVIVSKVIKGKDSAPTKFEQYYNYQEKASQIPSHRYLAIRRGEKEGILDFQIEVEQTSLCDQIRHTLPLKPASPFAEETNKALIDACKRLLIPSIETEVRVDLKLQSDRFAVDVFAENLRNLLLASPLGGKRVIGIDPGIRTGCKCAALDETGKFIDFITIYLHSNEAQAMKDLLHFIEKNKPAAIGIGNGTFGRETEAFVRKLQLKEIITVQVSEAGASVYSASDIAREEFPDLDLTIRGAISIGRRLQDPLAELVKVDPKAIGVGQYQHDVYQPLLHDKLNDVVESCVNFVGVELNTASAPLLSRVAGIGPTLAVKIVKHREKQGPFKSKKHLLEVSGLGPRTFEQAAGFLRIRDGHHPLDASAVHPERFELVEKIAQDNACTLSQLCSSPQRVQKIDIKPYINDSVGEPTLKDILAELQKPGRDPRSLFEKPCFREDVLELKDLKAGMKLEGIVTNVAAFGVFVDIGVHQDGLVHISELTDRYIKNPSEVARVGDKIRVEVLTVDLERKRIHLTAKQNRTAPKQPPKFNSNPFANLR